MAALLKNAMLKHLYALPPALFEATPETLHRLFPEPTLIHLSGKRPEPLFISVLLHGNEPTGFWGVMALLKKYQQQALPRSITLFFGNTLAAQHNVRRLEQQPDFNRIWPGTTLPESNETRMTQVIVDAMRQRQVFASIDIHNNTGLNPHYACINSLDRNFLHLARLFGRLVVYFMYPKGVQSAAFAPFCPAVTLECGRPGHQHGVEHVLEFLDSCLHLTHFPEQDLQPQDIDLFHTVAQVKVRDHIEFSFASSDCDLLLNHDVERFNFTEMAAGTAFGRVKTHQAMPLWVFDDQGQDVGDNFFSVVDQQLQLIRPSMPSMLTLDEQVIRQDCLCYLMERIPLMGLP